MSFNDWQGKSVDFSVLEGLTFTKIKKNDEEIKFFVSDNHFFKMFHWQDCCENVYIEDISGDLDDLIESPILHAEESTKDDPEAYEAGSWTFYKLATVKGWVDIRWYGSSNGYYSTGVSLLEFNQEEILKTKLD